MFFLKSLFLMTAVVSILSAQEIDSMEDMDDMEDMDLEAVEELPSTQSSNAETTDELKEPTEVITESNTYAKPEDEFKSVNDISKAMEGTTESMSEVIQPKESSSITEETTQSTLQKSKTTDEATEQIAIIFEEIENRLIGSQTNGSTQPSVVQTSTDFQTESSITSEYNGFDANKSDTTFSCYGRAFGQYADVKKDCRVFHLCYPYFNSTTDELLYQRISFLCDNDSVFDQKRFICVDNSSIEHKCSDSEDLYLQTNQEYLIRVFSQSVSPIDEINGQQNRGTDRNWMSWLYGH
jgi:hypothetical protein